jgi:hypothetical protein
MDADAGQILILGDGPARLVLWWAGPPGSVVGRPAWFCGGPARLVLWWAGPPGSVVGQARHSRAARHGARAARSPRGTEPSRHSCRGGCCLLTRAGGADEVTGRQMVDRLFQQADRAGTGLIDVGDVVAWVGRHFRVDGVAVPGQSLDRAEIAAVRARLGQMPS